MKAAEEGTEAEVDPRMTAIVERMFDRCAQCFAPSAHLPVPSPLDPGSGMGRGWDFYWHLFRSAYDELGLQLGTQGGVTALTG